MTPLLQVNNLRVTFPRSPISRPVDGISFTIDRGECLGLVGESGSGKTLAGLALLGLVPDPGSMTPDSEILLDGQDIARYDERRLREVRGQRIGLIFQDPMTSLNPVLTVGYQIQEAMTAHRAMSRREARDRCLTLMDEVGIPNPKERIGAYPHELSGGLRQRVMIAIALGGDPDLLIADEPTTALDVTVQAQILELLDQLRVKRGLAVLLITHDLGVVAGRTDRVLVMYAGQLIETGPTVDLFERPRHPYTQALLQSIPRLSGPITRLTAIPGRVPDPHAWPTGCRFHPRCAVRIEICDDQVPGWRSPAPGQAARCWLVEDRAE